MTMVNSGLKGLTLGQRRRRWADIKPILFECVALANRPHTTVDLLILQINIEIIFAIHDRHLNN